MDLPNFPEAYKPEATEQRDALDIYRSEAADLEWTYLSPAAEFVAGERTGKVPDRRRRAARRRTGKEHAQLRGLRGGAGGRARAATPRPSALQRRVLKVYSSDVTVGASGRGREPVSLIAPVGPRLPI
jgi:hypothetical protein